MSNAPELLMKLQHAIQDTDEGAPCEGRDLLFFPEGHESVVKMAILEAKAICRRCPFMKLCAQYAIEADENYGVWGTTTPDERRAIKRG
jgi:WhiB family redox-sensing transcriptional regulator